jgi:hypothetical protein
MTEPKCAASLCSRTTLRQAPFPLCWHHAAQVWQFVEHLRYRPVPEEVRAQYMRDQQALQPQTGIVYYVRFNDMVKIGHTVHTVQERMRGMPEYQLLAVEPGDRQHEATRLRQFNHLLARGREWFTPDAGLWDHIRWVRDTHGAPPDLHPAR